MRNIRTFFAVIAIANICASQLCAQSPAINQTLVGSIFKGGTDGWKGETDGALVAEIAKLRGQITPPKTKAREQPVKPDRDASSPTGGFITLKALRGDGQTLYFSSPNKYGGDRTEAYGGSLVVQFRQVTTRRAANRPFVVLASKQTILFYFPGKIPGGVWERIEVPLKEGAGWVNPGKGDGVPATKADFDSVLGALSYLWIRAEFSAGEDRADLAEVRLNKPAP